MSRRARRVQPQDQEEAQIRLAAVPLPAYEEPPPVVAIALGHLVDGRHVAVELHLHGHDVVGGIVLCVSERPGPAARAWLHCAYSRLCERRDYNSVETAANERDAEGVPLERVEFATAAALVPQGKRFAFTTFEVNRAAVTEPKVHGLEDKLTAWSNLSLWATRNLLPRSRR